MFSFPRVGSMGMDRIARKRRGPMILAYSELTDLGIPQATSYPAGNQDNYYRRNCWRLFQFGSLLFVGGGNGQGGSNGTTIGEDNSATCTCRAIDLNDDSVVTVPYASGTATTKEFRNFDVIDGELFIPSIDDKEGSNADFFRLEDGQLEQYLAASLRNHCYKVYRARHDGRRWFASTGVNSGTHNIFYSVATFPPFSAPASPGGQTWLSIRGNTFLEFGEDESSRLFCVAFTHAYGYWLNTSVANHLNDPSVVEDALAPKPVYEFNFSDNTYTPLTRYPWVGLERELTHPFVWPSSTGVSVSAYDTIQLEKCTPLSNNEYIGVFGKNRGSGGMSRFANPGHFYYFNTGANGILDIRVHGGVYKITLREEPAYPGVSNGSVSFLCERVLPNPETTGRQWDYQVVGSDIYVLTETEGGNIHVYKNTTEILRITGAPTYARSFAIVGSHIYFGLGSEARDPWWNSGAETISEHCGRVLKAANVL